MHNLSCHGNIIYEPDTANDNEKYLLDQKWPNNKLLIGLETVIKTN